MQPRRNSGAGMSRAIISEMNREEPHGGKPPWREDEISILALFLEAAGAARAAAGPEEGLPAPADSYAGGNGDDRGGGSGEAVPGAAREFPGTIPAALRVNAAGSSLQGPGSFGPIVTGYGRISWSVDMLGLFLEIKGTIRVEKPAGATVRSA